MSDFLVVVPEGWEQCSQTMLDSAIAVAGDFKNVMTYLDQADFAGLGSALDENRFPSPEEVIDAIAVQDHIFIKTRFI